MKKKYLLLILYVAISVGVILFFSSSKLTPVSPANNIRTSFSDNISLLQQSIKDLDKISLSYKNKAVNEDILKKQFLDTRSIYRKCEYLYSYLDPSAVKKYLNGAPLPKTEENVPQINIIEPKGFQVLDELIFSDNTSNNIEEIIRQVKLLNNNLSKLENSYRSIAITDRQVFEAMRLKLISIFTLEITGFDTPSSLAGLQETKYSMKTMLDNIQLYKELISDKKLGDSSAHLLNNGIEYIIANIDFDTFDRLAFLKEFINPLYGLLLDIQLDIGIETAQEIYPNIIQPVNYFEKNIFSQNFLNEYYYFALQANTDNANIKELGKLLFFDPILSDNNKRSCASCHKPEMAFTDGLPKSVAYDYVGNVKRNAPTVINSVYAERLFWDVRTEGLNNQIEHVVFSDKEFHTKFTDILNKLKTSEEYRTLFEHAFPNFKKNVINKYTVEIAIASYVASLKGLNSTFDKYVRAEIPSIDNKVIDGFNLFMGKAACATCHFPPMFNGLVPPYYNESESEVLGVPKTEDTLHTKLDNDLGRYANLRPDEGADYNKHAFKTVTVRNAELTAPYMHNGVYNTLEEVIGFYNRGGGNGMGLSVENQTLAEDRLNLTDKEKQALIAFMNSLTDTTGLTSKPKKIPSFNNDEIDSRTIGGEY